MEFVRRHWRGDYSLARSYWINVVVLSLPLNLGARAIGNAIDRVRFSPNAALVTSLAIIAAIGVIGTWQLVGVWRSANRTLARGQGAFWPNLAKVVVVIGFVSGAVQVTTSFSDVTRLHRAWIAFEDADYEIHRFGDELVLFDGVITTAAVEELLALVRQGRVQVLMVNSPGGLISPAYELALALREGGIGVIAADVCVSACVLLLAGGARSAVMPESEIAFHQPESLIEFGNASMRESHLAGLAETRALFLELDVAAWALDMAAEREFWSPSIRQQIDMGLVTHVYLPEEDAFLIANEFCALPSVDCTR